MGMPQAPAQMSDDPAVLKAIIAALEAENAKMSFAGSLGPVA
jgi:hypothetical protein